MNLVSLFLSYRIIEPGFAKMPSLTRFALACRGFFDARCSGVGDMQEECLQVASLFFNPFSVNLPTARVGGWDKAGDFA